MCLFSMLVQAVTSIILCNAFQTDRLSNAHKSNHNGIGISNALTSLNTLERRATSGNCCAHKQYGVTW